MGSLEKLMMAALLTTLENVVDEAEVSGEWVLVSLVAAIPLMKGAIPKDKYGIGVLPHDHRMKKCDASQEHVVPQSFGCRVIYDTQRVCDRCMERMFDRYYYHCEKSCDVDFCLNCQEELDGVLDTFFGESGRTDEFILE